MIDPTAIRAALDFVVDPCSNAMGEPLGLIEMGLVSHLAIDDSAGAVDVTMRLTSPCCAYGPMMARAAERELESVAEVQHAHVVIDHAAVWTPLDITAPAATRLEARRATTRTLIGAPPYDWRARKEPSS